MRSSPGQCSVRRTYNSLKAGKRWPSAPLTGRLSSPVLADDLRIRYQDKELTPSCHKKAQRAPFHEVRKGFLFLIGLRMLTPFPTTYTFNIQSGCYYDLKFTALKREVRLLEDRFYPGTHTAQVHRSSEISASLGLGDLVLVLTKCYV